MDQRSVTIDLYDAEGARTRSRHQHKSGNMNRIAGEVLSFANARYVACVITDEDSGAHAEAKRAATLTPTPTEWIEAYERYNTEPVRSREKAEATARHLLEQARAILEDIAENHPPFRTER